MCAITVTGKLLVASSDSYLYVYLIDGEEGGECVLSKQHCMLSTNECGGDEIAGESSENTQSEDPPTVYTN